MVFHFLVLCDRQTLKSYSPSQADACSMLSSWLCSSGGPLTRQRKHGGLPISHLCSSCWFYFTRMRIAACLSENTQTRKCPHYITQFPKTSGVKKSQTNAIKRPKPCQTENSQVPNKKFMTKRKGMVDESVAMFVIVCLFGLGWSLGIRGWRGGSISGSV